MDVIDVKPGSIKVFGQPQLGQDHRVIGKVTGWEEYGGPSLLQIDGGRVLIPFVKAICVDIRPQDRVIETLLPEGLE